PRFGCEELDPDTRRRAFAHPGAPPPGDEAPNEQAIAKLWKAHLGEHELAHSNVLARREEQPAVRKRALVRPQEIFCAAVSRFENPHPFPFCRSPLARS